jgi:Ni,Fe-hydrogenase maturation factor
MADEGAGHGNTGHEDTGHPHTGYGNTGYGNAGHGGASGGGAHRGAAPRVLVAGVGNIFLADDGFGPEVVAALHERPTQQGVHVVDFGIRGMDLAYRLLDGYEAAVLVDAAPRGGTPGTLYVIEADVDADVEADVEANATDAYGPGTPPQLDGGARALPEAHGMDPVRVLGLARRLAGRSALPRVLVLGCEPRMRMRGDEPDVVVELSDEVRTAVGDAVELLTELTAELLRDPHARLGGGAGRRDDGTRKDGTRGDRPGDETNTTAPMPS